MTQNRSLFLVSVLAVLIPSTIPGDVSAQTVLLDTFDGGTVGLAPATPEVGFSSVAPFGAHLLVNPDGNGDFRVRCLDDVANDGCRLSYFPTGTSEAAVASFLFRIESGVVANGGANDFDQQLIMSPPGTNLSLEWSAFLVAGAGFGQLGVRIFANGGEVNQFFLNSFQWFPDTDYFVEIAVDASTDLYSLTINGNVELEDAAFGADFTSLDRISLRSGFTTTGATQIDDVEIVQVPEAGALGSAMAALVTVGLISRRRGAWFLTVARGCFQ